MLASLAGYVHSLARGGDLAVVLWAGVQVVVVGSQPCLAQLARLLRGEHAQRSAHLHSHTIVVCFTRLEGPAVTA